MSTKNFGLRNIESASVRMLAQSGQTNNAWMLLPSIEPHFHPIPQLHRSLLQRECGSKENFHFYIPRPSKKSLLGTSFIINNQADFTVLRLFALFSVRQVFWLARPFNEDVNSKNLSTNLTFYFTSLLCLYKQFSVCAHQMWKIRMTF